MEEDKILQNLSKLDRKLDKILKLTTTIAKTLHIVPVTEKEEREIQLLQRKNANVMKTIQEEIANLEENSEKLSNFLSITDLFGASDEEVYEDVIGSEYFTGKEN